MARIFWTSASAQWLLKHDRTHANGNHAASISTSAFLQKRIISGLRRLLALGRVALEQHYQPAQMINTRAHLI